jgi:mediator of RNA polymerase II transcription subunit 12
MFASLVNLFSSLIRHDVFSHDAYLCTLIARGDLSAYQQTNGTPKLDPPSSVQPIPSVATPGPASQAGPATPASVSSAPSRTPNHDLMDDRGPLFPPLPRMTEIPRQSDFDDPNIDDDLDRILQHITQDQMDQADSPKDDSATSASGAFGSVTPNPHQQAPLSNSTNSSDPSNQGILKGQSASGELKESRHRQYVTHFQLPQDDSFSHEVNQRHILLYGVGRAREDSKHAVKKVSKDLSKLCSKKFCLDVADGSRVKKHSKNEINFESLTSKYTALPYYDQHAVTSSIAQNVVEMFSTFAAGRSSYLPTIEHLSYLTDLMEVGLNFVGLLEMCVTILRELPDIEVLLCQRSSPIVGFYTTNMQLQLVAVLRRYHNSLLCKFSLKQNNFIYNILIAFN